VHSEINTELEREREREGTRWEGGLSKTRELG